MFVDSLRIGTDSLPSGSVGTPYSVRLDASGGWGNHIWSMSGSVPGLTLAEDGVLRGTAESAGEFDVTVTVESRRQIRTRDYHIAVTIPVVNVDAVIDALLDVPSDMSQEVGHYLDFLGNGNGALDVGDFYLYMTRESHSPAGVELAPPGPDSLSAEPGDPERGR